VDKNKQIGQETLEKLQDILGLRKPSLWERTKYKFTPHKDNTQKKIKEALGVDKNKQIGEDTLLKIKELLDVDADKAIGEETFEYLQNSLGYEPGVWDRVKAQLSTLQDQASDQIKHTGHKAHHHAKHAANQASDYAQDASDKAKGYAQEASEAGKHAAHQASDKLNDPTIVDKIKEKIGLHHRGGDHQHAGGDKDVEKLIEEAREKAEESQEILRRAYAEVEKKGH